MVVTGQKEVKEDSNGGLRDFGSLESLRDGESSVSKNDEPIRRCSGGQGLCTDKCDENCCSSKCAAKFNEGNGEPHLSLFSSLDHFVYGGNSIGQKEVVKEDSNGGSKDFGALVSKNDEPIRDCTGNQGLCSDQCDENCCNAKCAAKFNQGSFNVDRKNGEAHDTLFSSLHHFVNGGKRTGQKEVKEDAKGGLRGFGWMESKDDEPVRKCNGGQGLCGPNCHDGCCNAKCASKYKKGKGIGYCDSLGPTNINLCNGEALLSLFSSLCHFVYGGNRTGQKEVKEDSNGDFGSFEEGAYKKEPVRKCTAYQGYCSDHCYEDCCNAKCAAKFKQGVGSCRLGYNSCTCKYVC
ncbi:unnamed protein product [Sphenostylis stenocarpa]|uniref:Defensin-like protein n=1 Tax=Sphenostylis stenocarpa TaxID=92480 RepID=A0AA86TJZ3_9FABA|nr:unnamed protein product [Sphenostylis stenocarpa]